jgi:hypothetical protein
MQKQTSLYIPTPCHEDWNKMTPTQQGKFCASCCKQVVDFSLMSDSQILKFLSDQSGKLCGRFDADQLQRPLVETKLKKKKSWWMALTMPLLFLFERSTAREDVAIPTDTTISPIDKQPEIMGKLIYQPTKEITVTGRVIDADGNPITYASIVQKGTSHGVMADTLGNFSININSDDNAVTLVASCVGFETIEKQINVNEGDQFVTMQIQPARKTLDDIIVTSGTLTKGEIRLGGAIAVCHKVTTFEKIDTVVRKVFNISAFKIYPNPAIKGSAIHIEVNEPGEYQLQLLDNQSRLIKVENINTISDKSIVSIQLPSNVAAGIYYLRLIDERKKKSYTEKLIIQ